MYNLFHGVYGIRSAEASCAADDSEICGGYEDVIWCVYHADIAFLKPESVQTDDYSLHPCEQLFRRDAVGRVGGIDPDGIRGDGLAFRKKIAEDITLSPGRSVWCVWSILEGLSYLWDVEILER
jgi:hypothetical protein